METRPAEAFYRLNDALLAAKPEPMQSAAAHKEALDRLSRQLAEMSDRLSSLEAPLLAQHSPSPSSPSKESESRDSRRLQWAQSEELNGHGTESQDSEGYATKVSSTKPSVKHGATPKSGRADFDYCFVFHLPHFYAALESAATDADLPPCKADELRRMSRQAQADMEEEDKDFRRRLDERSRLHSKWTRLQDDEFATSMDFDKQVRCLFKDLFFEVEHAEEFVSRSVDSYETARAAVIDLMLSFFRRAEEQYYSYIFTSVDQDELILCAKMLEHTAVEHAIRSNYPLQLDPSAVADPAKLNIKLSPGPEGPGGCSMSPAYVPPDKGILDLFKLHDCEGNRHQQSYLRKIDSIRLMYDRVTDVLDLDLMTKWGLMKESFPMHSQSTLMSLRERWANPRLWWSAQQPIDELREYFGETVTLYFVFTQHICIYTRIFAVVGLILMLFNFTGDGFNRSDILGSLGGVHGSDHTRVLFIFFVVVWASAFIVHLKRKFYRLNAIWGCSYGDDSEVKSFPNERFAMMAHMGPSDVDQNMHEFTVSWRERRIGRVISLCGTAVFIAFTLLCSGSLLHLKAYFLTQDNHFASLLASYMVTIQIKVCAAVWAWLCKILTDYEYHKDQSDYDSAVAAKSFYVQLINLFCSFIYVAFFMEAWGDMSFEAYGSTPWPYLTFQMITTFGLYLAFSLYDLILPMFALWQSTREEIRKLKLCGRIPDSATVSPYSYIELQTKMQTYAGDDENGDYLDVLGVFGFVAGFGVTFPLGAVFATVYLLFQMRVDAWKLTRVMKRPWPLLSKETWQWADIASQLMAMAITTNIAFLVMYLEPFRSQTAEDKAIAFFLLITAVAALHATLAMLFPPMSQEVLLAARRRRRQMYQVGQYKKKVIGCSEQDDLQLVGRGDADYLHIPPLQRSSGIFEEPHWYNNSMRRMTHMRTGTNIS